MTDNVNRLQFNISFKEDGLSELPYKQTQRENFYKLADLIVKRQDNIQTQALVLAYSRFLDNAEGDMLDKIASHYFIDRNGKTDEELKSSIKLHSLRQNTEPTRDDIVRIIKVLNTEGFIKIYKGIKNYVEVVVSDDCLTIRELSDELQELFPININLKLCSVLPNELPFGLGSLHKPAHHKVGKLGSIYDSLIESKNKCCVTLIDNEAGNING